MLKKDLGASKALAGGEATSALWGLCFMVGMDKKGRWGQTHGESLGIPSDPTSGRLGSSQQASGPGAGGDAHGNFGEVMEEPGSAKG